MEKAGGGDGGDFEGVARRTVHQRGERRHRAQATTDDPARPGSGFQAVGQRRDDRRVRSPERGRQPVDEGTACGGLDRILQPTTPQPDGVLGQGADHGGGCAHETGPGTVTTASTATTPSPSASTRTGLTSASITVGSTAVAN